MVVGIVSWWMKSNNSLCIVVGTVSWWMKSNNSLCMVVGGFIIFLWLFINSI